ncbi:MAG TPA: extradiol dioxygenase [Candidatus Sulfotelmatobacter sp.]|jgi:hypothetical protein
MIIGAHFLLYSKDAEADRGFFRDVLRLPAVDAGQGWLIFAVKPAEAAIHPAGDDSRPSQMLGGDLYFMCDDLNQTVASLKEQNVQCGSVTTERWGIRTTIVLPSGGALGLYQPTHPTALNLK